jgi:hypothetical protein
MKDTQSELVDRYANITKWGGYREIPDEIVKSAATDIGLREEEIPKVEVRSGIKRAYIHTDPSSNMITLVVPRREGKRTIPFSIKHELAHLKLGHVGTPSPNTPKKEAVEELNVHLLANGKLTKDDMVEITQSLMADYGITKSKALRIVSGEAKKLGASGRAVASAKKIFRYRPTRLNDWYTPKDLEVFRTAGIENVPENAWDLAVERPWLKEKQ